MVDEGSKRSVAVIGAGMAGIAAGRVLRDEGLDVTIFESSHYIGGVWRYGPAHEGGAMYRSLVTNLPKACMSYVGFPFPEEVPSFPAHSQIMDYLDSYAEQHDVLKLIRFGCPVTSVRLLDSQGSPFENGGLSAVDGFCANADHDPVENMEVLDGAARHGAKWEVKYRCVAPVKGQQTGLTGDACSNGTPGTYASTPPRGTEDRDAEDDDDTIAIGVFDAVCVCNGKFVEPFVPKVPGMDEFRGTVMHAQEYDNPHVEAFEGRRVLCVGVGYSARDIAREVSSVAHVVHVSDRGASSNHRGGQWGNVWWRPGLEKFEGPFGTRFIDGELEEIDTIVWCTGYNYSFPFLEGTGLLTPPVRERVHPLYELVFHVRHPSLSFIGLPLDVVPFPQAEIQANAVAAVISGRAVLPSQADREAWLLEEEKAAWKERGIDPSSRGMHVLSQQQWEYNNRLLRLAAGPGVVAKEPEFTANGHHTGQLAASQVKLSSILKVKEDIWKDIQKVVPTFPGDPDDYRLREYNVDWEAESFSVSFTSHKANGEKPASKETVMATPSDMD